MKREGVLALAVRGVTVRTGLSLLLKVLTALQSFVFARLFLPQEQGAFSTAVLVTSVALLFVEIGLRQYIVQSDEDPRRVMDTAFTLTLVFGVGVFVLLFISAPMVAAIFNEPNLTLYVRFMSYVAFTNLSLLPICLWEREMRFGLTSLPDVVKFFVNFFTVIVSTGLLGAGVWGLFYGSFLGFLSSSIVIWLLAPYRPRPRWDGRIARQLLSFGLPLVGSAILAFISWQGDDLTVRYFWGETELGFYVLGFYMPDYLLQLIQMSHTVMVSAFAKVKYDQAKLRRAFNLSSKYLAIFSLYLGVGLAVFAPQVIHHLYTDRWASAVPLVQLFALSAALRASTGYHWQGLLIIDGRTRYIMVINLLTAIFFCVVGIPLIYFLGGLGGALYSLLQQVVMNPFVRLPVIRRRTGDLSYLGEIWKPFIAVFVAGFFTYWGLVPQIHSVLAWIIVGVGYSVLYFGTLLLLDRNLLQEALALASQTVLGAEKGQATLAGR